MLDMMGPFICVVAVIAGNWPYVNVGFRPPNGFAWDGGGKAAV